MNKYYIEQTGEEYPTFTKREED